MWFAELLSLINYSSCETEVIADVIKLLSVIIIAWQFLLPLKEVNGNILIEVATPQITKENDENVTLSNIYKNEEVEKIASKNKLEN